MSGDIYKIGISLVVSGNTSQFFAGLSRQILGAHAHVHDLDRRLDALSRRSVAVGSGIAAAVGIGLISVAHKLEAAGEKLTHAQTVFSAGLPAHDRAAMLSKATAAAWQEAGKNMNTTVDGNLEAVHDIYNVVQSLPHALNLLPTFNVLKTTLSSVKDGKIGEAGSNKNVAAAVRAFELSGHTTEETLKAMGLSFSRTTIALRGRVDGQNYLTAMQGAGDARYGWTEDFATKGFPALINAVGPRVGNMLNMLNNNLYGGVTSSGIQAGYQIKYGLHTNKDLEANGKAFKPGTVWQSSMLRSNPLEWANAYRERLRTMGFNVDDTKTMQDIIARVGRGNRNVKNALDELLLPNTNKQFNKEISNINNVDVNAAGILSDNDPKLIHDAFHKQWENFLEAFGSALVDPAMRGLKQITGAIRDLTQAGVAYPGLLRAIGLGIAALGVALTAGGTVALLAALGPAGWLTAGIVGLTAALAGLVFGGSKETLHRLSMFYALAKSEALIIQGHLMGLAADPKNMEMIRSTLATTGAEFEVLKTGLGKALEWYRVVLGWRQKAQDAILGLLGKAGGGGADHPGMSESAREGLRDREVDPMGVFVTKLIRTFKELDRVLLEASDSLAKEIASWPGKLANAITAMGSAIVAAIGNAIKGAITGLFGGGGASVTPGSFDGTGLGGATIQKASLGGGGKLDIPDFGGGAGGTGGTAFDAIMRAEGTAGKDPYNVVLGNGKYGLPSKALTDMTLQEAYAFGRTVRARHGSSSAIGAFQIVGKTMKAAAAALGLDMNTTRFTPEIQRRMAKWIAKTQGLGAWEGLKSHPNERARARSGGWNAPADRPTVAPAPKQREYVAHNHTYLDGRKIASSVTRHQFDQANGPAQGAGSADSSLLYPQIG